jgi:hypothetical protein
LSEYVIHQGFASDLPECRKPAWRNMLSDDIWHIAAFVKSVDSLTLDGETEVTPLEAKRIHRAIVGEVERG